MDGRILPDAFTDSLLLKSLLEKGTSLDWKERGERMAVARFHRMASSVPAYKDFLQKNNVDPSRIETIVDLKLVPPVSKDNYLRVYPYEDLFYPEDKDKHFTYYSTSGSTGEPFFFAHTEEQDRQYAITADLYLVHNFHANKKKTLYINGFPMGSWIGGVFTNKAIRLVAETKGYPLSLISPGIHKGNLIDAIKKLAPRFEKVLIGSYGPFLKDLLEDGERAGIDWKKMDLGFICSAEAFSEDFRDYLIRKAGIKDELTGTLNHYGTVDLGTMAWETPLSILARKQALKNTNLYKQYFGDTLKLPTFAQYIPELFYFEEEEGRLLCTAVSGIPLVRYDLKDNGGVISYDDVLNFAQKEGIDLESILKERGHGDLSWKLPFVYVYERSDLSISFYAFQVYPEMIRRALFSFAEKNIITGKFTMFTKFDEEQNQYIDLNIELGHDTKASLGLTQELTQAVTDNLLKESSEFAETYKHKGDSIRPRISLWDYEDPLYFRPGTKQKWILK